MQPANSGRGSVETFWLTRQQAFILAFLSKTPAGDAFRIVNQDGTPWDRSSGLKPWWVLGDVCKAVGIVLAQAGSFCGQTLPLRRVWLAAGF